MMMIKFFMGCVAALLISVATPSFAENLELSYGTGKLTSHEASMENLQMADVDFLLYNITNTDFARIDWRADIGVLVADKTHPFGFSTLITTIPIYKTLSFSFGGGLGYIHHGYEIEGLGDKKVAGTIRAYLQIDYIKLGVFHVSKPWENDSGRNMWEARVIINW